MQYGQRARDMLLELKRCDFLPPTTYVFTSFLHIFFSFSVCALSCRVHIIQSNIWNNSNISNSGIGNSRDYEGDQHAVQKYLWYVKDWKDKGYIDHDGTYRVSSITSKRQAIGISLSVRDDLSLSLCLCIRRELTPVHLKQKLENRTNIRTEMGDRTCRTGRY